MYYFSLRVWVNEIILCIQSVPSFALSVIVHLVLRPSVSLSVSLFSMQLQLVPTYRVLNKDKVKVAVKFMTKEAGFCDAAFH